MKRKVFIYMFVFVFAMTPLLGMAPKANAHDIGNPVLVTNEDTLTIVQNGQAQAVVVISEDAGEEVSQAADTLVEYVAKSTGATLPITTVEALQAGEENDGDDVHIYIGEPAPGEETALETAFENLDEQGFLIHPSDTTVTIAGPTVWGTRNGVYDFLERYLDIRWLMPGPEGEDVPQLTDVLVPLEDIREEPAFTHRVISAALGDTEWWKRNKIQLGDSRPIQFQENLHSLFPTTKYGETHPEFYPGGNPPAPDDNHSWQPCFTAEGSVDAAVEGLIEYFDEHPEATSYSLGINDSRNFCEADPSHPHYPGKTNSVGDVDMSEIYYTWVNEVVEQVLEVYPDKWFGLLAYNNVTDPPSFPLNDRVVPFITKDRLTWIDDEIRTVGHQQMEAWNEVAKMVGWYDYMYGTFYVLPRVFPHVMAENFQYAAQHDVYGHYIEMYHNIGDGPKAWIAAKLMWDPYQDVDALMQEWYERMVGPEAASDLAAYFELWEGFWTNRIKDSAWFETGKGRTYLPFTDASYVELVTDADMAESERLLELVVAKAGTSLQKARAQKFLRMFEYYEASVLSYPRESDPPKNATEALEMLDGVASGMALAQRRYDLIDEFEDDPALRFRILPRVDWSGQRPYDFWQLVNYLDEKEPKGGPLSDQIRELATSNEPSNQRDVARLLEVANSGMTASLLDNPSFEEGDGDAAPPWGYWIKHTGSIERVEGIAHTGNASLLVDSLRRGGPNQTFDIIQSGLTAVQVRYYTPPGTEEGTIQLVTHAKDADGNNLVSFNSSLTGFAESAGEWSSIGQLEVIPASVDGEEVTQVQVVIVIDGAENEQVYIDDAVVYQYLPSSADMKTMVQQYVDEGEIDGDSAAHALKLHLTAVDRFEQQEAAGKVVKHMQGFKQLLDYQYEQGTISEKAYHTLVDNANVLIKRWQ